jgi:hypothetical protein
MDDFSTVKDVGELEEKWQELSAALEAKHYAAACRDLGGDHNRSIKDKIKRSFRNRIEHRRHPPSRIFSTAKHNCKCDRCQHIKEVVGLEHEIEELRASYWAKRRFLTGAAEQTSELTASAHSVGEEGERLSTVNPDTNDGTAPVGGIRISVQTGQSRVTTHGSQQGSPLSSLAGSARSSFDSYQSYASSEHARLIDARLVPPKT